MNKRKKKFLSRDDIELTLLSLPTLIWFIVFSFIPMIGILIAFKDFRILPGQSFIESLITSQNVGF